MLTVEVAKVLAKGQVTIPKEIRAALGISEGDYVAFVIEDGVCTIERQPASLSEFMRLIGETARPLSDEEWEEIDASGRDAEERKERRYGI